MELSRVLWFRNDLRIADNTALLAAMADKTVSLRTVIGITELQWQKHAWGKNKIGFYLRSALFLQQQLAKLNISLEFIVVPTFKELPKAIIFHLEKTNSKQLFFNHEYELNEMRCEQEIIKLCKQHKITCKSFHDQLIVPPNKILNKQHKPYTVFTAFKKNWLYTVYNNWQNIISKNPTKFNYNLLINNTSNVGVSVEDLKNKYDDLLNTTIQALWPVGEKIAKKYLTEFCTNRIAEYAEIRDLPAINGTSKLSPYLAVGSISARQCLRAATMDDPELLLHGDTGMLIWVNELIWRDFYKHIVFHYPEICKGKNFNQAYNNIIWRNNKKDLDKWQQGQTGLPIIDAAMRQLRTTGWMHNRLRMVVAMFLSKNLLINWQYGEAYFAEHLIDLDFAANNGGWQWSASTGTDAVPYFRIFNPVLQSKKFDPEGRFIKQYCPELSNLNIKQIHDPSSFLSKNELNNLNYPEVMVDLKLSRQLAIQAFVKSGS